MISYTENATNQRRYNNVIVKRRLLRLRINIFVGGYALASTRRRAAGRALPAQTAGERSPTGRAIGPL